MVVMYFQYWWNQKIPHPTPKKKKKVIDTQTEAGDNNTEDKNWPQEKNNWLGPSDAIQQHRT